MRRKCLYLASCQPEADWDHTTSYNSRTIIIIIRIIGTYRNNIMHYYVWFYICTVQLVRWARGQWAFPFYILSMGYCIDIIFYDNNPIEPVFR